MRPLSRFVSPLLIALVALFVPASIVAAQRGPGVTQTVPPIFSVDIGRYGATASSTYDNTLAIQAALDAVHAAGGGEVTITRPGTYVVTGILTSGGSTPTSPNTTLNSALVVYSDTTIRCVAGVTIQLGLARDDSKCYLITNADHTGGNSNITIDGGFWSGGGVIAEATAASSTTITIPGDYSAKVVSGATAYLSSALGKNLFTVTSSSFGAGVTTITGSQAGAVTKSITGGLTGAEGTGYFQFSGDVRASFVPGGYIAVTNTGAGVTGTYKISSTYVPVWATGSPGNTRVYVTTSIPANPNNDGSAVTGLTPGGFSCSWQLGSSLNPAIATVNTGTKTFTFTSGATDYRSAPYSLAAGSSFFVYNNAGVTADNKTAYTIASISYSNPTTTIVTNEAVDSTTTASGNAAFVYNRLWYQDGALFQNVSNLNIRNTKSGGWDKYAWWLAKCTGGDISNNTLDNASDGFHFTGCRNFIIRNTRGRCLDNMIPILSTEHYYRPAICWTTCSSSWNITIDGFVCDSTLGTTLEPIRLVGKYVPSLADPLDITDITIRGGRGYVTNGNAIKISDDLASGYGKMQGTRMSRILIEDMKIPVATGYAVVDISASGAKSVTVRDLQMGLRPVSTALTVDYKGVWVRTPTGAIANTRLEQLTIDGLNVDGNIAGTTTINPNPSFSTGASDKVVAIDAFVSEFAASNWHIPITTLVQNGVTGSSGTGLFVNQTAAVGDSARTIAAVLAGASNTGYFAVAGNLISTYPAGSQIYIAGNSDVGSNGLYTISTQTPVFDATNTRVYVTTTISASVAASGTISVAPTIEGQIHHGSLSNAVFNFKGAGNGINFAHTEATLQSSLHITNTTFTATMQASADPSTTSIQIAGKVNLGLTNVTFDLPAAGSTPLYLSASTTSCRLSGSGIRYLKGKNSITGNAAALDNIVTTNMVIIGGTPVLNCTNKDFPIDISGTGFTTATVGNGVSGDMFMNTSAQALTSTGSPGGGVMHFVADNGAAGGSSGSGYWEMVGTPKPATTAVGVTLSPYHSKLTLEVTAAATIVLPPAKLGMTLTFLNNSSGAVVLDGNASETLNNTAALNTYSTTVSNSTQGSCATYKCLQAGKWNLVAGSW